MNRPDDWIIGTESEVFSRSISNPKDSYNPDTYEGQYWYTADGDNGGVHTNSGVFAHIFHMLSVGKSGENDHRNLYTVQALGNEKTGKIMYRALDSYLTPNSEYDDAREAMIQSASDLYGSNSHEKEQVMSAFYAGGVGCLKGQSKSLFSNRCVPFGLNNLAIAGLIVIGVGAGIAVYQIYYA